MKQAFYVILILGLIYFCYWYITKPPDIIEVTGSLRVLEENADSKTADNIYNASIYGTAANKGEIIAKDIWVTYTIDDKEVNAYIGELLPNQQLNFRTGICRTNNKNPEFEFVSVRYNE